MDLFISMLHKKCIRRIFVRGFLQIRACELFVQILYETSNEFVQFCVWKCSKNLTSWKLFKSMHEIVHTHLVCSNDSKAYPSTFTYEMSLLNGTIIMLCWGSKKYAQSSTHRFKWLFLCLHRATKDSRGEACRLWVTLLEIFWWRRQRILSSTTCSL